MKHTASDWLSELTTMELRCLINYMEKIKCEGHEAEAGDLGELAVMIVRFIELETGVKKTILTEEEFSESISVFYFMVHIENMTRMGLVVIGDKMGMTHEMYDVRLTEKGKLAFEDENREMARESKQLLSSMLREFFDSNADKFKLD